MNYTEIIQSYQIAFSISMIFAVCFIMTTAYYAVECRNYRKRAEAAEKNLEEKKLQLSNAVFVKEEALILETNWRKRYNEEYQNLIKEQEECSRLKHLLVAVNRRYRLAGYAYDKLKQELSKSEEAINYWKSTKIKG